MSNRLDEERLEILRKWGAGLATDDREEVRAAGKAITVLIDEIDRLQVDLWNLRVADRDSVGRSGLAGAPPRQFVATTESPATALRDRVTRVQPQAI